MKKIFWFVLVLNLAFFALMQWGPLLRVPDPAMQPQLPLNAEKITLLPASATPAAEASGQPPRVSLTEGSSCLAWGEFNATARAAAGKALAELQLGTALQEHQVEQNIGYWVYLPPQKDKTTVARKIAQLKARGVREYFVVQDAGPWHNAISLGIFKTPEAAQGFLQELRRKGVNSAQMGERESNIRATVFQIADPAPAIVEKLNALQKRFSGTTLKRLPCGLAGYAAVN
ncbi:MAG: SPOR domain-containing protein [Gallionella sp.]|nr:SPOR domain-containing protein [Gallionella sp.]